MNPINELCAVYCLSYNNQERKLSMENRFKELNINATIYEGVNFNDPRIFGRILDDNTKRVWSFTYGHFDMIEKFYNNTDKEYGIFCEDDILIHKNLSKDITNIIEKFKIMNLDLLLLGYILDCTNVKDNNIQDYYQGFDIKASFDNSIYKYYNYPDNLWGAQMYMITRKQAKFLLDKYIYGYADKSLIDKNMTPFSIDWTATKDGRRASIYPMYAIENGKTHYNNCDNQEKYHQGSFLSNYNSEFYV